MYNGGHSNANNLNWCINAVHRPMRHASLNVKVESHHHEDPTAHVSAAPDALTPDWMGMMVVFFSFFF